jgi:type II secretory pathway predicted ATPase ExeA
MEDIVRSANPFEYQAPIRKEELFFDRRVELKEALLVCERIVKGSTGGISIYGGRGAGKTSLLNTVQRELQKRKIASARIPLDDSMVAADNEPRLFKLFLNDLTTAAQEAGLIDKSIADKLKQLLQGANVKVEFDAFGLGLVAEAAKDNKFKDLPYAVLRDGLRDFSKLLARKQGGNPGAILILDEADLLKQNKALLQIFKNVFQDTPGIGLILAGTSKLMSEVSDVFSPIPRFFHKIELGPFSDDDEVENAITKTVQLAKNELVFKGKKLNVVMSGFIRLITDLTNRQPVEFNMLSYFAYDIGSTRMSYKDGAVTLFMKLDKELLDVAMRQWQGQREYVDFLEGLSGADKTVMSLLSKSRWGASVDELTTLVILDRMGVASRPPSLDDLKTRLEELGRQRPNVESSLQHVGALEEKCKVKVLNPILATKPIYEVEDQWVKAYFKYSVLGPQVNLEFGLISENSGALIFGDPVSSILDSVFLPRVIQSFEDPLNFQINSYPNDGRFLTGRGKIVNATYKRVADNRVWHLAFHLKPETETVGLKKDMETVLEKLGSLQLIHNYKVMERIGSIDWS